MKLKIIHTADLHMDSPFEALPPGKAAARRSEQRTLLYRLADLAVSEHADLVLLSGDLLDSDSSYFETGEELVRSLRHIPAPVFIAPGNHDFFQARSPYARLPFSDNVHIFKSGSITCFDFSDRGWRVFGAAFTGPSSPAMLRGFSAERKTGVYNVMCIHGEPGMPESSYNPVTVGEIASSGMDYIGFGHVHKASGLKRAGKTWYSMPGCPEGRGFDETGEKTVSVIELDGEECSVKPVSIALRKYEILKIDVSSAEPVLAAQMALPGETLRDIYRIVLTGETDEPVNVERIKNTLSEYFYELQIRDDTRPRRNIWETAGEDTLRGIFLEKLRKKYDAADSDEEKKLIGQAARWGIAALDNMEEVVCHED